MLHNQRVKDIHLVDYPEKFRQKISISLLQMMNLVNHLPVNYHVMILPLYIVFFSWETSRDGALWSLGLMLKIRV